MARRGNEILANYQQRIRDEKDAQTVTAACAWCGQQGGQMTLAAQRDWRDAHILEHHSDRKVKPRFGGRRSSHRMLGKQTIEDNIANARAQGASTWVNNEDWVEA